MIRPPKRAVTRFFIPLIDVLILLFCIFLLMPFVEKGATSGRLTPGEAEALRKRIAQLEEMLAKMNQAGGAPDEVRRLEEELAEERSKRASDKVNLQTLYFDRDKLILFRTETTAQGRTYRREISKASEAAEMAAADGRKNPSKELVYLVMYPPGGSPKRELVDMVGLWFGQLARVNWVQLDGGGNS